MIPPDPRHALIAKAEARLKIGDGLSLKTDPPRRYFTEDQELIRALLEAAFAASPAPQLPTFQRYEDHETGAPMYLAEEVDDAIARLLNAGAASPAPQLEQRPQNTHRLGERITAMMRRLEYGTFSDDQPFIALRADVRALLTDLLAAASPAPNPDHSHAAAPTGYRCADCQIDGEPCPRCYEAGWRQRHPNVQFAGAASPAPHDPPMVRLQAIRATLTDTFGLSLDDAWWLVYQLEREALAPPQEPTP